MDEEIIDQLVDQSANRFQGLIIKVIMMDYVTGTMTKDELFQQYHISWLALWWNIAFPVLVSLIVFQSVFHLNISRIEKWLLMMIIIIIIIIIIQAGS